METLRLVLLFVHILGYAALLGGLLVQVRDDTKRVNSLMRDGSGTAFLAGLLLVGVLESLGSPDHAKIGVKLLVALGVVACAEIANARHRRGEPRLQLVDAAGALTLLNVFIAFLWH